MKTGRPKKSKDFAVLSRQRELTIPEVLAYVRAQGRRISRATILDAVVNKRIAACVDETHKDRNGCFLLSFDRIEIDRWLKSTRPALDVKAFQVVRANKRQTA